MSGEYSDEEKRVFWEAFTKAEDSLDPNADPEKAGEDALRRFRVRAV